MSNDFVLDIDHESAGLLAGTLLAGDSCAVPVRHQNVRLLLCALLHGAAQSCLQERRQERNARL